MSAHSAVNLAPEIELPQPEPLDWGDWPQEAEPTMPMPEDFAPATPSREENTLTVLLPISTPDSIPALDTFPKEPGPERDLAISDLGEFYASWWMSGCPAQDWTPATQPRCNLTMHIKGASYVILSRCLLLTGSGKRRVYESITQFRKKTRYCRPTISAAFLDLETQHFAELMASYEDPARRRENESDLRAVRDHATWAALYPGVCHLMKTYGLERGQEQTYFWAGFNYVLWLNHRYITDSDGKRKVNPESHPTKEELRQMRAGTLVYSASGRLVKPKVKALRPT